jgi:hypothetical protein
MDIRTKRLRDAQPGEIIATDLGAVLKTAILVESVYCYADPNGDYSYRAATGTIIRADGYSRINVGRQVSVCTGAP